MKKICFKNEPKTKRERDLLRYLSPEMIDHLGLQYGDFVFATDLTKVKVDEGA